VNTIGYGTKELFLPVVKRALGVLLLEFVYLLFLFDFPINVFLAAPSLSDRPWTADPEDRTPSSDW
jgi:hypothetical protein